MYYQQLCTLIADKPKITKEVTDMYIKRIRFFVDIHRIYIKSCGIKGINWCIGAYKMDKEDIEQIVKEWLKEWKNSAENVSHSDDEETLKDKDRGKEKVCKKKEKRCTLEKQKASQDESKPHKRKNLRAHKLPTDAQLGSANYDCIATYMQETLEGSMIGIVSSQTAMKSVMDMQIVELNTLLE